MTKQPERRVTLRLKIGADSPRDLVAELLHLARLIESGKLGGKGVSGGYSTGHLYEYIESDGPSHDEYFQQLDAYLEERQRTTGRVIDAKPSEQSGNG